MYLQRNYTLIAERYLKSFPVLCVIGPRQAGKTSFVKSLCPDWQYYDLERQNDYDFITRDFSLFFEQNPSNIIIDEAQESPQLFKELRGVVDSKRDLKGRFILTGSSSPELIANLYDSLAGRIGIIELDTLKANEFYQQPLSTFYELFNNEYPKNEIEITPTNISNADMRHCWLYGGYPEPLLSDDQGFYRDWMDNYFSTYINRDIAKLFPRLNKISYQKFVNILSSVSGSIINKADIARAIEIGEKSVGEYLQIAEQTFIWRNIIYDTSSTIKSIVKKPKGYIADSGLQHYLLQIKSMEDLLRSISAGKSFESFVIEEIIKGVTAYGTNNVKYYYYRTAKGSEVDLVITTPAGRFPIEIKMATNTPLRQLASLTKYINDYNLPYGILINQSDRIAWVTDKILQIPVSCV